MKKKVVSMLLVGTMAASMMAGCGGSSTASADKSANDSETVGSGSKVQVDFWYSGGKTAVNVVQEIVDEYNASQDTYEVNTVTQGDYDETYQKLQAGIAGDNAPALALIEVDAARNLNAKGLLTNLNDYISEDDSFEQDDYLQVFYDQGVDADGDVFAIPAYGTTQVLYYNMAAFDEAGIDATSITTWQDLADAAATITEKTDYTYGWEPMWGCDNLIDAVMSNGGSLLSEDGKTVTINSDEWVEVWEAFRTWIHDDETMSIHSGGQGWEYWYATIDDVINNVAGGYTGSSGDQADLDFSVVAAMEQPGWGDNESAPAAEAKELVAVNSVSEEQQAGAYDFMKYFTSAENQATWSMETGYVAVRNSTQDVEEFKAYAEENPQILVPLQQASHGSIMPEDPTGGEIYDALATAADQVEIEGVSAKEALDQAQETAQKALDKALN